VDLDLNLGGAFTVMWDDFINSPDTALWLGGGSASTASTVSTSSFGQGGWGTGPAEGGAYYQESGPESATRFTAARIDGTESGAYYNAIANAGTAGIDLQGTTQYVYGNLLVGNRYEISDGSGGGQLDLDQGHANASAAGNVINGINAADPSAPWPPAAVYAVCSDGTYCYRYAIGCLIVPPSSGPLVQQLDAGIEVFGTGHGIFNNEIAQHSGGGILVGGIDNGGTCTIPSGQITISSANPWDPSDTPRYIEGNQGAGIVLLGNNRQFPCNVQGVVFDDILVRNNAIAGVYLDTVQDSNSIGSLGLPFQGFFNSACTSGNENPGETIEKDVLIMTPDPTTLTYAVPAGATVSLDDSGINPGGYVSYQYASSSYRGGACPTPSWPALQTPAPSHIPTWPW
jgi:hypothetical protein